MIAPPALKPGDLIYITAPAKSIDEETVRFSKEFFEEKGFRVLISKNCFGVFNYFSGTDQERMGDLQYGIDHPEVKAIVCARGGYGCIRILEGIQWANMLREPKWLIGFSDVTVFHHRLNNLGVQSIHGTMSLNFEKNSPETFETLLAALERNPYNITTLFNEKNKIGSVEGLLIGGNLSIVYSLLGTSDSFHFEDKILFLEDLAEHYYHIDRMFFALKKAGALDKIKGLVIGGMTDLEDTTAPFGMSLEDIVLQHFQYRKIPICFDFPAGHLDDNRAIIFGANVLLEVTEKETYLRFNS
jgi:muramoyltetrapeptide carboxypeptidase